MHRPHARHAFTLVEVVIVVVLLALLAAIALGTIQRQLDRLAVRHAVREAALAVGRARDEALAQHAIVTLRIDTAAAALTLHVRGRQIAIHALGQTHGVVLSSTRDSIAFDVRGLGYGAANLTLVARRGSAADTLIVSRLGRARY